MEGSKGEINLIFTEKLQYAKPGAKYKSIQSSQRQQLRPEGRAEAGELRQDPRTCLVPAQTNRCLPLGLPQGPHFKAHCKQNDLGNHPNKSPNCQMKKPKSNSFYMLITPK